MTPRPGTEQLLVKRLMRTMQAALHAHRARPPEESSRSKAEEEHRHAFAHIWSRVPFVTLTIAGDSITWDEHTVLDSNDDAEGLIAALATAGVTSLTLVPGVESSEMRQFLEAIDQVRGEDFSPGSDLLTLLFRADLQHLRYSSDAAPGGAVGTIAVPSATLEAVAHLGRGTASGTSVDAVEPVASAVSRESVRDAVREDAAAEDRTRGLVRLEQFDSTLYFLDQTEIEYLRSAIDREYSQDLAINGLSLLLDTLQLHTEPRVRSEAIGILTDLMPYLLGTGRFDAVAYLISEVRKLARDAVGLTADHKSALDRMRASVSDPKALAQLFHSFDDGGVRPTHESMGVLLRELRPEAIRQVLGWSDRLANRETNSAVAGALEGFFTQWPQALSRMLTAPDTGVVHAALDLAARLRLPTFVDVVAEAADHEDPGARLRVARALTSIGTATAMRHLTSMTDDQDQDVREAVYGTFAERPYRGAMRALEQVVKGRDLEDRRQREKRALFEAYGAVSGPEGIPLLEALLRGKSVSRGRPSSHTRACAAIALGIIGTPGARAALEQAARDRDPVVRSAVGAALRGRE